MSWLIKLVATNYAIEVLRYNAVFLLHLSFLKTSSYTVSEDARSASRSARIRSVDMKYRLCGSILQVST